MSENFDLESNYSNAALNSTHESNISESDNEDDHDDEDGRISCSPNNSGIETLNYNPQDSNWSHSFRRSKYQAFFDGLFYKGKRTGKVVCKIQDCGFTCSTKSFYSIRDHIKKHPQNDDINSLTKLFRDSLIAPAFEGKPFSFLGSETFSKILEANANLAIAHNKAKLPFVSKNYMLSESTIARRVRNGFTDQEHIKKFEEILDIVARRGSMTMDFGHNKTDFFVVTAHETGRISNPLLESMVTIKFYL